ncbi:MULTISPECIES: sporulation initiation phosphotransferase B [Bacillus]|uniref:sporulation initiation phosphotransferase B n=1 Tax=Bacillus TaxID=1386 RepID=UPI0007718E61|nr:MULTISPECIES: sporulation initiation phosphotransferase B [Bacillus]MCY1096862.1 sporulation initiation phosphotransferase B [Bacillus safensis]NWF40579.1 sporulation protein [Bacillus sp. 8A6]
MEEISSKENEKLTHVALTNELIDLLSRSRHDWMNKLQLIKGNLTLEKYDRVFEIIEEMVIEAQHESKLSNLKIPQLAYYFLTFNWESHFITLEYEVLGETRDLSAYESQLLTVSQELFSIFDQSVCQKTENHLTVTFQTDHEENDVILYFDFKGKLTSLDALNAFHDANYPCMSITQFHVTPHESMIELCLRQERDM